MTLELTITYSLTHSRGASVLVLGLPLTLMTLPSSFLVSLSLSRQFHSSLSFSLWQRFISSRCRSYSHSHSGSFCHSLDVTLTLGSLAVSISLSQMFSVFSHSQSQLSTTLTRLVDFGSSWCGIFHVTVLGFFNKVPFGWVFVLLMSCCSSHIAGILLTLLMILCFIEECSVPCVRII